MQMIRRLSIMSLLALGLAFVSLGTRATGVFADDKELSEGLHFCKRGTHCSG